MTIEMLPALTREEAIRRCVVTSDHFGETIEIHKKPAAKPYSRRRIFSLHRLFQSHLEAASAQSLEMTGERRQKLNDLCVITAQDTEHVVPKRASSVPNSQEEQKASAVLKIIYQNKP